MTGHEVQCGSCGHLLYGKAIDSGTCPECYPPPTPELDPPAIEVSIRGRAVHLDLKYLDFAHLPSGTRASIERERRPGRLPEAPVLTISRDDLPLLQECLDQALMLFVGAQEFIEVCPNCKFSHTIMHGDLHICPTCRQVLTDLPAFHTYDKYNPKP